tara:strand:+ start:2981 stop:3673 length:693 start_codon:yes stop_codon:yes gene_type:complete
MNIHAVICTRDRNKVSPTTNKLVSFLCACNIGVYILSNAKSLFSAYEGAFKRIDPDPEDITIFCHDDIEIRENPDNFVSKLKEALEPPETGFVGPAGTMELGPDSVWWDQTRWQRGKHRGTVFHIDPQGKEYKTHYGEPGEVVVLDGLFLAAKRRVIDEIGLEKPKYFEGEWDFYDIHYTSQAFLKGFTNKVLDLNILHNSRGELVGRDSWHKNREAFIANNELPLEIKE